MTRTQKIFFGLLILQLVLAAFVYWPRTSASGSAGPLLGGFDPARVTSLEIEDDQQNSVTLARSGDGWVLASGGNYPADGEKVEKILSSLQKATTGRLVTRTETSHQRLGVGEDSFMRRLVVTQQDGKTDTLYIGSAAGGTTAHIRKDDSKEVYLADNLAYYSIASQPSAWIDPIYVSLPDQAVTKIVLKNNQGTFTFTKDDQGKWQSGDLPEGEVLAEGNVSSMENTLKSLRMSAPLGEEEKPEYGMSKPSASVEFTYRDSSGAEKSETLLIGSQLDGAQGNYVIKSSTSTFYVTGSSGTVGNFVTRSMQDFIQPRPTATVEATAAP